MSQFSPFTARSMKQLSVENWDAFIRALDARFGVLEEQLGIEREVTEAILQRGLQVIEDQLAPTVTEAQNRANEVIQAARNLGLLFRASSSSTLTIGTGSRSFVVNANERNRFAAPLFVIAAVAGDVTRWMSGQVTAWDVASGTLTVSIGQTRGEGTFAAWDISIAGIPPEAPPAQAIDDIPGLSAALAAKAPLASPAFTGTPSAPTPATSDNSMRVATTAYVKGAINALIDAAPGALDTLNELAAALGDDPNFATTMINALAEKVNGPAGGVVDNEFPTFSGSTGRIVKASGHLKASVANVRAAAANRLVSAEHIETASALATVADAATIAVDWDAFINGQVTLAGNRTLGNPTNIQIGTWRTILATGNDATERTLTFGANYRGVATTIAGISSDSGKRALIPIFGWTSTLVVAGAPLRF